MQYTCIKHSTPMVPNNVISVPMEYVYTYYTTYIIIL